VYFLFQKWKGWRASSWRPIACPWCNVSDQQRGTRGRSVCAPIIEDIKNLVDSFACWFVMHVSWLQNESAHSLAQASESLPTWCGVAWHGSVFGRQFVLILCLVDQYHHTRYYKKKLTSELEPNSPPT
jgi:hypothetical protein